MLGLGAYNPFPFTLGGGESTLEIVHRALCDKYEPGWDVSDDTIKNSEAYAEAMCIALVWACNERLSKQWQPGALMEWLETWESATQSRPTPADNAVERRAKVAAKMRGAAGNTLSDIIAICELVAGQRFVEVVTCVEEDALQYWPGQNPGPPGLEWASNRLVLGIKLDTAELPVGGQSQLREDVYRALENVVPSWMRITVGSGSRFQLTENIVGSTFI